LRDVLAVSLQFVNRYQTNPIMSFARATLGPGTQINRLVPPARRSGDRFVVLEHEWRLPKRFCGAELLPGDGRGINWDGL
jgi:hypothetical protein